MGARLFHIGGTSWEQIPSSALWNRSGCGISCSHHSRAFVGKRKQGRTSCQVQGCNPAIEWNMVQPQHGSPGNHLVAVFDYAHFAFLDSQSFESVCDWRGATAL